MRMHAGTTAAAWSPASVSWDVSVGSIAGLGSVYSAASGGSLVTTEGTRVNGWANVGSLGGRLGAFTSHTGPVLRTNSGAPYLEWVPSGVNGRALGLSLGSTLIRQNLFFAGVVRYNPVTAASSHHWLWTTHPDAADSNGACGVAVGVTEPTYGLFTGGGSADGFISASGYNPAGDGGWHLLCVRRTEGSPNSWKAWVDGQVVLEGTDADDDATGTGKFFVGGPSFGSGYYGDVAASHFLRTTAVADETVDALWGYYKSHPLLLAPAKGVLWVGDSVSTHQNAVPNTDGSGTWNVSKGLVVQVAAYLRTNVSGVAQVYNASRGGWSVSLHNTEAEKSKNAAWLSRATGVKTMIVFLGHNDMNTLTAAQFYAALLAYCNDMKARVSGLRVCVVPPNDHAAGGTYSTRRSDLLVILAASAAADGLNFLRLDQQTVGSVYGTPGRDAYYLASDGLHAIAPGMTAMADYLGPQIATVINA